jgi:hypothetical protein
VRSSLARVALSARAERKEREGMWFGWLPKAKASPARAHHAPAACARCRERCASWSPATAELRHELGQPEAVVPLGTALLSGCYCALSWEAIEAQHVVSMVGVLVGSVMWWYEERKGQAAATAANRLQAAGQPKAIRVVGKDGATKFHMELGTAGSAGGMQESDLAKFRAAVGENEAGGSGGD